MRSATRTLPRMRWPDGNDSSHLASSLYLQHIRLFYDYIHEAPVAMRIFTPFSIIIIIIIIILLINASRAQYGEGVHKLIKHYSG